MPKVIVRRFCLLDIAAMALPAFSQSEDARNNQVYSSVLMTQFNDVMAAAKPQ